jgi:large subunit ribosomal protein L15
MKINDLQVAPRPDRKRVGRGISAGGGKTAGRGTKGQNSRTGKKHSATFVGGQGPLMQRVPKKHGFKSLRIPAQVVYTDVLNTFTGKIADNKSLAEAGLVASPFHAVKIIVRGELTTKAVVKVQGASKGAQAAITKAGGSFEKVETPHLPANEEKAKQKAEAKADAEAAKAEKSAKK